MTETETHLKSRFLIGATAVVPFLNAQFVEPHEEDRLALINPLSGSMAIVSRNASLGRADVVDSVIIMPAIANAVQSTSTRRLITIAPRSITSGGQLRAYFPWSFVSPEVTVDDDLAGSQITVQDCTVGDDTEEFVFHSRTTPPALVVRAADTLAEVAVTKTRYGEVARILPGPTVDEVLIFHVNSRWVERVIVRADRGRFDFGGAFEVPHADAMVDVAYDGERLLVATPDYVVVYDVEEETTILVHHDPKAGFSSMVRPPFSAGAPTGDGAADADYQKLLYNARFNPGKDRNPRDPYLSAEQLSRLGALVGTTQSPTDRVSRVTQPIIRPLGLQWAVVNPITGRLVLSGDLVWRFRGGNANEHPRVAAYDEPDAVEGTPVSHESARGSRMSWYGSPKWRLDPDYDRFAYFDGETYATFGNLKYPAMQGDATFTFWVRSEADGDAAFTLMSQSFGSAGDAKFRVTRVGATVRAINSAGTAIVIPDVLDGDWHLLVWAISSDGSFGVYVDGELVDTSAFGTPWTPASPAEDNPLYLGRSWSEEVDEAFVGWLGDCRIYRLTASAEFIADLFTRGTLGVGGSLGITSSSLLLESGGVLLLETGDPLALE
jgi:hypothetical protein